MEFLTSIKNSIPDYAKDIRLNVDSTIARSSLEGNDAVGVALAAAFATKNKTLVDLIKNSGNITPEEVHAALTAAALMGMNNVWYPFVEMADDEQLKGLPAQLRMNAIASHGGTTKARLEAYSLAASIVGKCHFCVKAHYDTLKKEGYTVEQLRDIGRIAAVIVSVARVVAN
mgnify:CR=1 FL=1